MFAVTRLLTLAASPRAKWAVAAVWVVIAAAAGSVAGNFQGAQRNDPSSYLPGSAESSKALADVKTISGGNEVTNAVVVYQRAGGLKASDLSKIEADRATLNEELPSTTVPAGKPIPSRDGQAALLDFGLRLRASTKALQSQVGLIREVVHKTPPGLEAKVTGPAGVSYDGSKVFNSINSKLLLVTASLVFVLLIIIYRSPIFWTVPLLAVGFAEVTSEGLGYALTQAGVTINGQSAGILTVLVFGAGTDYALLLVARYREELHRHRDRHEAMALALRRAGPVIFASACTVIAALLCMLAAEVNGTKGLGPIGAMGIAIAMASGLTLLPALLVIAGRRAFWPFIPRYQEPARPAVAADGRRDAAEAGGAPAAARASDAAATPADAEGRDGPAGAPAAAAATSGVWQRIADRVDRSHRPLAIGVTVVLATMCFGLLELNTNLTQGNSFRGEVESQQGQTIIEEHFPAGASAPAQVIVPTAGPEGQARLQRVRAAVANAPGVAKGPQAIGPVTSAHGLSLFTVTLAAAPSTNEAFQLIGPLREVAKQAGGQGTLIGGPTAEERDLRIASSRDNKVVIPMVLAVVFAILALLLRALVAPLLLVASVLLSFGAALGAGAFAFERIFDFPGEDPALLLFSFIFLVALGVDYTIFLMARVREETTRTNTRTGVIAGLAVTGGVITSAGIVLAGTFATLASLPLVTFTEVGAVISFGVLLDTFVVRTVLVPTIVIEIGRRVWWPSKLSKASAEMTRGREPPVTPRAAP